MKGKHKDIRLEDDAKVKCSSVTGTGINLLANLLGLHCPADGSIILSWLGSYGILTSNLLFLDVNMFKPNTTHNLDPKRAV